MIYTKNDKYELRLGTMQEELLSLDNDSIDSIVTDPPYELGFMGKAWDSSGVAFQKETWEHCLRVLKPGGYLLAFGGSRTYHRIACAIEDAGFEIRDTIQWLYGSGFPKSMNIGLAIDKKNGVDNRTGNMVKGRGDKECGVRIFSDDNYEWKPYFEEREAQNEWNGWGTHLKPAYEPVIVARKPFKGSLIDNIEEYKVGGINIDECRVPLEDNYEFKTTNRQSRGSNNVFSDSSCGFDSGSNTNASASPDGRFPANVILTYDETDFDEVCGGFPNTKSNGGSGDSSIRSGLSGDVYQGGWAHDKAGSHLGGLGDEGSASRYFYCAKASKKDRDEGLDGFEEVKCSVMAENDNIDKDGNFTGMLRGRETIRKNIHPTVKPCELMQYLVRLVTPKNGIVLDPFMGSGSTGKATMIENVERNANYKFIGIEMTEEYLPICKARIDFGCGYVPEVEVDNSNVKIIQKSEDKESLW